MNPDQQIRKLEETKTHILREINQLDEQLEKNEITSIEYHALLHQKLGGKTKQELINEINQEIRRIKEKTLLDQQRKQHKKEITSLSIAAIILIILALTTTLTQTPTTPTGYTITTNTNTTQTKNITKNITINQTITKNTNITINHTNITSIKITGKRTGTATIKLKTNNTEYLVANITSTTQTKQTNNNTNQTTNQNYTLTTNKKEYALGETVYIRIEPEAENKSLYVTYKNTTQRLENNTYTPQNTGEHQIISIIVLPNNSIRLETNITVTNQTTNQTINKTMNETKNKTINQTTTYEFSQLCTETCNIIEATNPTLTIELEPNTTLTITTITITTTTTTTKQNQPPKQTKKIPNITLKPNQTKTLNLNQYFTDPDQDTIIYDTPQNPNINTTIKKQTLTIKPKKPGTHTTYIYATDGTHLTTSNTFTITILPTNNNNTNQTTNQTKQNTTNTTNTTSNQTTTPTNTTTNPCQHPNPNQRPPECLEPGKKKPVVPQSTYLTNTRRKNIARITPLGNLVLKGKLYENAEINPNPEDFVITKLNEDHEEIPIAYIDTTTGNMYIKGKLYEEDFYLTPTPNAYVIQNKKNLNLAYLDRTTGNLHLKGNLVENREVIR